MFILELTLENFVDYENVHSFPKRLIFIYIFFYNYMKLYEEWLSSFLINKDFYWWKKIKIKINVSKQLNIIRKSKWHNHVKKCVKLE